MGKKRINPDKIELIQDEFLRCYVEKHGRMAHACLLAGIQPSQVRSWMMRDPVFEEKFEDARLLVEDNKREVRDDMAFKDRDRTMLAMALRTLPEHTEKKIVEHTGQINHAHAHAVIPKLSKEERDFVLKEGTRLIESGEI